jgi:hypothetical protein
MTKDEALRLAWDALQQIAHVSAMDYEYQQWAVEAITAIKEALAQPEQEPMTKAGELRAMKTELWKQREQDGECKHCTDGCPACDARKLPEQEPVAWRFYDGKMWCYVNNLTDLPQLKFEPLYTTPPHSTWVGLTDEEINLIYAEPQTHVGQYAKAIEAKLKEKNNG